MGGKVLLDVEVELLLLGLGAVAEDADVGALLELALVLDEGLLEFVGEFEVAGGEDLEDGVAVVLEVEDVVVGLVLGLDVGEALRGEEALVLAVSLEALDQDALPEFQVGVVFLLRHARYVCNNKY